MMEKIILKARSLGITDLLLEDEGFRKLCDLDALPWWMKKKEEEADDPQVNFDEPRLQGS
jgi:hypothetical protein